jgi:hypothetical protein
MAERVSFDDLARHKPRVSFAELANRKPRGSFDDLAKRIASPPRPSGKGLRNGTASVH